MAELRIALILGGGVSLGSFSAGALSRLLRLLEFAQRGPAKIDVVTGASAGSMTLSLMLYHLFRGSSLDELERALRDAWVRRINFEELCPELKGHDRPSLFSDRIIREIACGELHFDEWSESAPHPYFAEGTLASFALTNLNGMPVRAEGQMIRQSSTGGAAGEGRQSVFADAMQTTFHDDVMRFVICRESGVGTAAARRLGARELSPWTSDESRTEWKLFREAAIASGAFPGAFPPVRLPRRREEYATWPEELARDDFVFDYVDGGVLRNEPLKEAIQLAAARDEGEEVERVFILIDPNVSGTRERYPLGFNQRHVLAETRDELGEVLASSVASPNYMARLGGVVGRLLGVLSTQAAFRDWLRATRVNSQIEWRDELSGILEGLQPRAGSDAEGRVDTLIEKIYLEKALRSVSAAEEPDPSLIRESIQRDLIRRAEGRSPTFTTKLHLLLDLVANLREKRKINMVAITPASTPEGRSMPIAGNFLSNFGGFFDQSYREYDFAAGEYLAAEVLTAPIPGAQAFLSEGAERLARPDPPRPDPSYGNLPAAIRRKFEQLVGEHAKAIASLAGLPSITHGFVASKVRQKVRAALHAGEVSTEATFVVQITGATNLFLRQTRNGGDRVGDSHGRIETVVAARRWDPGIGSVPGSALAGPHLVEATPTTPPKLELYQKRFLRPAARRVEIRLEGPAEEWHRRAARSGVPILDLRIGDQTTISVTPDGLREEPYPLP